MNTTNPSTRDYADGPAGIDRYSIDELDAEMHRKLDNIESRLKAIKEIKIVLRANGKQMRVKRFIEYRPWPVYSGARGDSNRCVVNWLSDVRQSFQMAGGDWATVASEINVECYHDYTTRAITCTLAEVTRWEADGSCGSFVLPKTGWANIEFAEDYDLPAPKDPEPHGSATYGEKHLVLTQDPYPSDQNGTYQAAAVDNAGEEYKILWPVKWPELEDESDQIDWRSYDIYQAGALLAWVLDGKLHLNHAVLAERYATKQAETAQ